MEYIKLPKDYFDIPIDERIELANKVVFNKALDITGLIEEESLEWITSILNRRLNVYINEDEFEQADFMDRIIKIIINNFENDEKGV
jgi:hypothetical protein